MSLLAQELADVDEELTVTGTDRREYEHLVFDATSVPDGVPCLDIRFFNVLPIPRDDLSLADILAFKRKRQDELLHFQQQIDEMHQELSAATEKRQINEILFQFS